MVEINVPDVKVSPQHAGLANHWLKETGIQEYLDKDDITEIIINKPCEIVIEKPEGWQFFEAPKATNEALKHLTNALANYNNLQRPDQSNCVLSMVLPNGERLQVILPPASENYSLTIRKPSLSRFTLSDYAKSGRFSHAQQASRKTILLENYQSEMMDLYERALVDSNAYIAFIKKAVEHRMNFLIVGGTGSGKTTVAKAIADEFPHDRRMITIEDVHEMPLPYHKNKVHLFYKKDVVHPKFLIESAMRMKPDHIILAELRGDEAWSYLEALNTGHQGSITTIHANDTYSAFSRLASIIKQSPIGMTLEHGFIMKTVKTSIDIVMFFDKTYLKEIYFNPIEKNEILAGM